MIPYIRLVASRTNLGHLNNSSLVLLNSYNYKSHRTELFHSATNLFLVQPQRLIDSSQLVPRTSSMLQVNKYYPITSIRLYSQEDKKLSELNQNPGASQQKLTSKDKFKKAVKEYGSTVVIFHVSISLISLGCCYLLVSNELNIQPILEYFGWQDNKYVSDKAVAGTSTFVVAYALHKIFAPARIGITIGCTPFIVRYLRARGILKK